MLEGKRLNRFFATQPRTRETAGERVDRVTVPQDGVRIPLAQRVLLSFEQIEQAAILGEFRAEAVSNAFPMRNHALVATREYVLEEAKNARDVALGSAL